MQREPVYSYSYLSVKQQENNSTSIASLFITLFF